VTVYNGEIYNYKEIKKELEAKGHIFKTDCDTEVIVHGYEQWGADCVDKFNGMFAFAVRDNSAKKMWVVLASPELRMAPLGSDNLDLNADLRTR
ncbi:MAG: asparagine synthetase B, partial [Deltaproteobacteria bacterium]|nr:asparagine synthetase B [Deltaproteobacteria bacterium]